MTKWILIAHIFFPSQNRIIQYEYPTPKVMTSEYECTKYAMQVSEPLIVKFTCKEVPLDAKENEINASL